ncbi:MAG: SDR family oxidoreductase [Cyclobacteriaceae bacterium]|nr:SDR family oxidoreductase [Cyclobacteriaceae bacterium]
MKSMALMDKVAVVTGGGGILCSEMGKTLAREGAKVALIDIHLDAAKREADRINDEGGEAIGLYANVLDKESLEEARQQLLELFGPCDILINGAGGNHPKGTTSRPFFNPEELPDPAIRSFFDLSAEGIDFVFNLNFMGTFLTTQVFAADMVGKEDPCIINISSMNAFRPLTKIPAYSAAKAAISNFTQWLAVHFAHENIRVNALAPGFFLTEQNRTLLTQPDGSYTERGQTVIEHTPMGRFGTPQDLSSTLLWLCDPGSSFVTGVVVPVDGGFSAFSGV